MSDLVSRAELFDALNCQGVPYNAEVNMIINGMPSAQPEIIMCKDCVNYLDERCLVANHHVAGFSCCLDVLGAERKGEQP